MEIKTQKEMAEELDKFCEARGENNPCHDCPVAKPCAMCYGAFQKKEFFSECWEAYDILQAGKPTLDEVPTVTHDPVNHPKHYCREGAMECIDEMIMVFGIKNTIRFCMMNAHKYRYRSADKNQLEDIEKSDWYYRKAKELMECHNITNWWD